MSERWVRVTLITDNDEEHSAFINMDKVIVVVNWKSGTKLEIDSGYVYVAQEPPMYFMPDDGNV